MKTFPVMEAEADERGFTSSFDPVLNGVAQGLAVLFPPIENARHPAPEHEAGRAREAEDDRSGE